MRVALIPVKELSDAKTRLAPVLDAESRRELALAMFRDVLAAATVCEAIDGVVVVTTDATATAVALESGAEAMPEPGGLNEALTSAAVKLGERGVARLVVLAADLPLATPDAIARVAEDAADIAIVASADGGTNALACAPGALAFAFGPGSAARHADAAASAVRLVQRMAASELELDIDSPEDLARLRDAAKAGRPVGRHTSAALGLAEIAAR